MVLGGRIHRNGQCRADRAGLAPAASLLLLLLLFLLAALSPAPALGAASFETAVPAKTLPAPLRRDGWRLLEVPGKATAVFSQDRPDRIEIRAENAVAFLYRALDETMGAKRRLLWSWRLEEAVPPTDLSRAPGDDRSLAVHLVFPMDETGFSLWQRLETAMTRLVAPPLSGKVLTYVWGGKQAPGSVMENPFLETRGRIIVLRGKAAPLGRWLKEEIDFVADYRAAFGSEPLAPSYIALSADSDDTASRSVGTIADLLFEN